MNLPLNMHIKSKNTPSSAGLPFAQARRLHLTGLMILRRVAQLVKVVMVQHHGLHFALGISCDAKTERAT